MKNSRPVKLSSRHHLLGRGGGIFNREGNRELRRRLKPFKKRYRALQGKGSAQKKLDFKMRLLKQWKDEDRKFIEQDPDTPGVYNEIEDKRAIEAIRQKLMEKDDNKDNNRCPGSPVQSSVVFFSPVNHVTPEHPPSAMLIVANGDLPRMPSLDEVCDKKVAAYQELIPPEAIKEIFKEWQE